MKTKSKTTNLINAFVSMALTKYYKYIKCIRLDNVNEFLLQHYYKANGINDHTSYVGTLLQNGIVQRKHNDILSITQALFFQA